MLILVVNGLLVMLRRTSSQSVKQICCMVIVNDKLLTVYSAQSLSSLVLKSQSLFFSICNCYITGFTDDLIITLHLMIITLIFYCTHSTIIHSSLNFTVSVVDNNKQRVR